MFKVGSDIGGTFTDTVFLDERTGELVLGKVLTTPQDPSIGAVDGVTEVLRSLGAGASDISQLIHGTTLVSNAIIERKGARTGLITTRGFRDVLEARTGKRYDLYDPAFEMPEPLVPRFLRKEVIERLAFDGTVVQPLDEAQAQAIVRELVAEGVEAIAVCFLHSFRNPAHELAMKAIIREEAPDIPVSLSVEVVPEIREYPRTSTTAANAYAEPLMRRYMLALGEKLRGQSFGGNLYVMLSGGGITTGEVAARFPVRVLESGPAAGAIAAAFYGQLAGLDKVLSFDMGGTTAKVCFIEDGRPTTTSEFEVARVHRFKSGSGLAIKLPVIQMLEIGAGGGSIAYVDRLGLMKVGPQSAGADPGPACYGRGGPEPTVTDADLVLGYLDPDYFLGGKMALDRAAAEAALRDKVASPLGMDLAQAAWGVHQVVNENMVNAARVHAAESGRDVKSYALVAFGGAGPIHACAVAQKLGMPRVVVPLGAGVTSAVGFLAAPLVFDFVRSYMAPLGELEWTRVNDLLGEMEAEGTRLLRLAGVKPSDITLTRTCDMRYVGQGHEIKVPIPLGRLDASHLAAIQGAFDEEYLRLYHLTNPQYRVEGLNWRVVASGPRPVMVLRRHPASYANLEQARKGERPAFFPEHRTYRACPVYDRYKLFEGASISGPAIIEERESTVVVPPGARATADQYLNLTISLGRA
ncbi:MAG: hydantoinase/oxoprolinase family protein [Chloroflexi bacterium]|nr:hydantoinase/oxoprolinase family protein [Chloroflexota bacterium]